MVVKQIITGSSDLSHNFTEADSKPELGPIANYILKLTKKSRPKMCYIGTAAGDSPVWIDRFYQACQDRDVEPSHLALFKYPNHKDIRKFLLSQNIIWIAGGSTANLLAVWKVHNILPMLKEAWEKGVILGGYSAGSLALSAGGTTNSYGPIPQPFINKDGLLPYSSGVHDDVEELRHPVFNNLVGKGKISEGYTTDEGVSIHFIDTKPHKIITDTPGNAAYRVYRDDGKIVEYRLEPELL